eukprot:XP_001710269.1 Hypothetical protein GL50803_37138 [Giardia lamblia ATCC 50803]
MSEPMYALVSTNGLYETMQLLKRWAFLEQLDGTLCIVHELLPMIIKVKCHGQFSMHHNSSDNRLIKLC